MDKGGSILSNIKEQIEKQHLAYDLYSVPFVKPIDKDQLKNIVEVYTDGIIIVEEHQSSCGVSSAILEIINELYNTNYIKQFPKIRSIAIPDEFIGIVGSQNYLRKVAGLYL